MKKREIKVPLLVIILLLGLSACNKKDQPNDAIADVYVRSILADGEPVFGLVHYVVGYSAMDAVIVNQPDGASDQLNAFDNTRTTFYTEPSILNGTYSLNLPEPGVYNYGVTFDDGEQKVFTNVLSDDYLVPPTITSLTKAVDEVNMAWNPMTGVEYYQLSILKSGILLYTSQLFTLNTGSTSIDIPISVIPSFTQGTYTFQLDAIDYEDFNKRTLQALSSASADIDL